jgi:glycogen debranching enzyme
MNENVTGTLEDSPPRLLRRPIAMEEAVGYAVLPCDRETPVTDAITLKHDRLFMLADRSGNIDPPGLCSLGLFHDDTRILSHYALRTAGTAPALLSAQVIAPYYAQIDLAVTDHAFGGNPWDPKHAIYIRRELLVEETLFERLTLTNFLTRPIDFWIELGIGCDFADIFEVRGWKREARGQFLAPGVSGQSILFGYRGRDGMLMETAIQFHEQPEFLDTCRARWSPNLAPGVPLTFEWEVGAGERFSQRTVFPVGKFGTRTRRLGEAYERWRGECSRWTSNVEVFDKTTSRAVDDLRSLYVEADGEQVISAGIPWYATVFGRDSIITSLETLPLNPRIAIDTLRYLARHQGTKEDAYTEEQPG